MLMSVFELSFNAITLSNVSIYSERVVSLMSTIIFKLQINGNISFNAWNYHALVHFSNMLPSSWSKILYIFDVFNFNSGQTKFSSNIHLAHFICVIHLSIATFATIFIYTIVEFLSPKEYVEVVSELLQYLAVLFTYWSIIFDTIFHRQVQQRFWNKLKWVDQRIFSQSSLKYRNFLMKFVEFFTMQMCMLVISVAVTINNIKIDFMYNLLFEIIEMRLFYYLFCLEILTFQLEYIENELKNIQSVINIPKLRLLNIRNSIYTFELKRLKWIRNNVFYLHEITVDLNEFFGWSHVATILALFYLFLSQINWCYVHLDEYPMVFQTSK